MKFILDANIPYSSLEIFEGFGLKAVHVADIGLKKTTDVEILSYAARRNLIIVTRDLDFGTLAIHEGRAAYGIIILRLPFSFAARNINAALQSFLGTVEVKMLRGALVIVELGRYRIRKL